MQTHTSQFVDQSPARHSARSTSATQLRQADTAQVFDARDTQSIQRQVQSRANQSSAVSQLALLQAKMAGKAEVAQRVEEELVQSKFDPVQRAEEELLQGKFPNVQRVEDEEPLQAKFNAAQRVEEEEPAQKKSAESVNNTGLPNQLKAGIESLSGISMDHVRVHTNSDKPAQLNAHAFAQGSEIHVAPGQEQHLPHEAWHVVQQAQGRVKPTMQMKTGVPVNDDVGLETEADVMGAKALSVGNSTAIQAFGWARYNTVAQTIGVMQQRTAVNYVGHFAGRHILVGASDEQAIARAASRQDPAQHNHVLTATDQLRNTAFEDQLTLECANGARAANHEFVVATPAKKASKVRNDPNPNGGSARRHAGNYDLTATVDRVTAVLDSGIAQNADAATIKTVKD
nr:DUF4157 domain-containing protein [uncultured Undibacterium sp.]